MKAMIQMAGAKSDQSEPTVRSKSSKEAAAATKASLVRTPRRVRAANLIGRSVALRSVITSPPSPYE
jgi:hypothetical protein